MAHTETLLINEIYLSLQGESTWVGLPCVFIRLTGCDLRCSYCDTAYAFRGGDTMSVSAVRREVHRLAAPYRCHSEGGRPALPLVELTGGEPLLQRNVLRLAQQLCDEDFTVLIETSGAHDISDLDQRVRRIVDLKCPSSGEMERNCWENLQALRTTDEIKFVIGTVEDYEWAKAQLAAYGLNRRCAVLFAWTHPLTPEQRHDSLQPSPAGQKPLSRRELAERILAEALPVRFQVQLHKVIWSPEQKGV